MLSCRPCSTDNPSTAVRRFVKDPAVNRTARQTSPSGTPCGAALKIHRRERHWHCAASLRRRTGSHSPWLVIGPEASEESSDRGNLVLSVAWHRIHIHDGRHSAGSSRRFREGLVRYQAR